MESPELDKALEHDAAVAREQKQGPEPVLPPPAHTWKCAAGHVMTEDALLGQPPLVDKGKFACHQCHQDWLFATFPATEVVA